MPLQDYRFCQVSSSRTARFGNDHRLAMAVPLTSKCAPKSSFATPTSPPPSIVTSIYNPQVFFAGVPGITLFSGSAPGLIAGVTQINVQLPAALPSGTLLNATPTVRGLAGTKSPPVLISVKP
jgi:uncharacterized protein (TIGR03437 family)